MNNEILEQNINTQLVTKSDADRIAAFKASSAVKIEQWNPSINETLVGIIVGHQKAVGTYGESFQLLVGTGIGIKACWITAWLKENLRVQDAKIDDLIALTFLGKKQSPAGRPYNAYSLIIQKKVDA